MADEEQFFAAIPIDAFRPVDDFKAEVDQNIRLVRGSRKARDRNRILTPGEIEHEREVLRESVGMLLYDKAASSLKGIAAELDPGWPWRIET